MCVECGHPDAAEFTLAYGDDTATLMLCRACVFPAMCNIAATIELFTDTPFDKAIARLERKMYAGTGTDSDLRDLARYRMMRDEARTRHPSGRATQ